jgi:hypothetical protein
MNVQIRVSLVAPLLLLASITHAAAQVAVFDGTFSRSNGTPVAAHASFSAAGARATITLLNGGVAQSPDHRVSAATIRLNERVVFDTMQFNQNAAQLEAEVDLLPVNDLEVLLEGKPGGTVAIRVVWPGQQDLDAIGGFWDRLAALYKTSRPSAAALTAWFAANVAPDLVTGGAHYADELAVWIAGGGPGVGITFSPVVTGPLDVAGTPYAEGVRIRLDYQMGGASGSLATSMVFDGSHWLWYGDQEWVETELMPYMTMILPFGGPVYFTTGMAITLWDGNDCAAYRSGVRSAIVTGPGLPAAGVTLYHMYPLPHLRLYPNDTGNPAGSFFVPLDDAAIAGIPDAARYTIRLYAKPADIVSLADTPLTTFVKTNPKRPLLSSEMNPSVFPALVIPSTHNQSALTIGGEVLIRWTNVPGITVGWVFMNLSWNGQNWRSVEAFPAPWDTSATLDASAYTRPPWHTGEVRLIGADGYQRVFDVRWLFSWQ